MKRYAKKLGADMSKVEDWLLKEDNFHVDSEMVGWGGQEE